MVNKLNKTEKEIDDALNFILEFVDGTLPFNKQRRTIHNKLLQSVKTLIKHNVSIEASIYKQLINYYVGAPIKQKNTVTNSFFLLCEHFAGDFFFELLFTLKKPSTKQLNKIISCMKLITPSNLSFGWVKTLGKLSVKQKQQIESLGYIKEHIMKLDNVNNDVVGPLVNLVKKLHPYHVLDKNIKQKINDYVIKHQLQNNNQYIDSIFESLYSYYGCVSYDVNIKEYFINFFGLVIDEYVVDKLIESDCIDVKTFIKNNHIVLTLNQIKNLVKKNFFRLFTVQYIRKILNGLETIASDYGEIINNLNLDEKIWCPRDDDQNIIDYKNMFTCDSGQYILNDNVSYKSQVNGLMNLYNDALKKKYVLTTDDFLRSIKSCNYLLCALCMCNNVQPNNDCINEIIKQNVHTSVLKYCVECGINLSIKHLELACEHCMWHFVEILLDAKIIPNQKCGLSVITPYVKSRTKTRLLKMKEYGLMIDNIITRKLISTDCYDEDYGISDDMVFSVCHNSNIYTVKNVYLKCHLCDAELYTLMKTIPKFDELLPIIHEPDKLHKYHYDLILERFIYINHKLNDDVYEFLFNAIKKKKYLLNMISLIRIRDEHVRQCALELFDFYVSM